MLPRNQRSPWARKLRAAFAGKNVITLAEVLTVLLNAGHAINPGYQRLLAKILRLQGWRYRGVSKTFVRVREGVAVTREGVASASAGGAR